MAAKFEEKAIEHNTGNFRAARASEGPVQQTEEYRKARPKNRRNDLQVESLRRDRDRILATLVQRVVNESSKIIGNCEVCGEDIVDAGSRCSWICGRCGKLVCYSCGRHSPGYGYGEDKEKYRYVCLDCYWELREAYVRKWKFEFGDDTTVENPYELTEEDRELRERISTRAWRTEDG